MPISKSERLGKSYESKSTLVSVGGGQKVDGKKFLGESKYQKYIDELTSSGTIGGEPLSPAERKEGFKKREDKIGFENFVKKILDKKEAAVVSQGTKKLSGGKVGGGPLAVASPKISSVKLVPQPVGSVSEETKENLDEILGKIDSILDVIKSEEKTKKKRDAENRRENEKKKRKKKEQKLESSIFKGLAKQVDKVLKPVKSIFQKIFEFFTAIFLGRIVTKIFDWLGEKENQDKVKNFIRFLSDFWPVIAGAYLLFGTKFGKLIRTVGKWAVQIAKFAIPKLLRFVRRNPRTAILLAGAGYLGSRILTSKEVGADDEGGEEASTEKPIEMSKGGRVPGSGNKDTVPAMLTPGEFVMSKGAVAKYGVDTLSSMNAMGGGTNIPSLTGMGVLGYQGGGEVSGDPNRPAKAAHAEGVGYNRGQGRRRAGQREQGESARPAAPSPSPSAPAPKISASPKSKIISTSHPDTGSGYSVQGLKDEQGRPAIFSKGAAEAFAKMMKDSKGVVKGSDIASSQRSRSKNAAVGGARNSNHLYGNALDIHGASQTWMRKNGARYGWNVHDYAGSHGGHFNYRGSGSDKRGGDGGGLVLSGVAKSRVGNDSAFLKRVDEVSKKIGANPADLLGLMASESGLNPQSVNSKSGATGLIQFTPGTASSLGTSTSALKGMNRVQQMDYVEKYLLKYAPKNPTPGHLYTSVFLPAFAKKSADYVVAKKGGFSDSWGHHPASWYSGNAGLDLNNDGSITIAELGERIKQKQKAFGIGGGSAVDGGTLIADSSGGGGGGGGGVEAESQQMKSKLVYDPQTQSYVVEDEGGTKKLDLFDWEEARRSLGVTPTQSTSTKAESISKPSRPSAITSTSNQKAASVTSAAGGVAGAVGAEKYRTNIPLINSMAMTSTRKIKTLGIMI